MLKFADQSRDLGGQDTHKVLTLFAAPDFVKKATLEQRCGSAALPPAGYADPVHKLYPCHTPAATWLSTAFFLHKQAELPNAVAVSQRLDETAAYFGISGEVKQLRESFTKVSQHDEAGLPDELFALVVEYDDSRKERRYPMRNAAETKTAADYLHRFRREFSYTDRQQIATKILTKAAEYGASLGERRDELERTAGRGIGSTEDTIDMLMTRSRLLRAHNEGREPALELQKMAEVIQQHPDQFRQFDKLSELAAAVDEVDRHFKFPGRYGQGVLDFPEDTLFAINEKLAADLSAELISTVSGSVYKRADLEAVPLNSYREAFGDDFIDAVSVAGVSIDGQKLAEVVATLPRPDAEQLDMLMSSVGRGPFGKQAAAGFSKMDTPQVQQATAAYVPPAKQGSMWAKFPKAQPASV
jgi:hypothetical protein